MAKDRDGVPILPIDPPLSKCKTCGEWEGWCECEWCEWCQEEIPVWEQEDHEKMHRKEEEEESDENNPR